MGCWYKTCGLSGLHIFEGNPVYVFMLEQNPTYEQTYTTGMFAPLLLPFEAEYDEYGGVENCTGFVDMVVNGVRDQLIEMDQGDNEYHDIPVHRNGFNVEKMINAAQEGRLFTRYYMGGSRRTDFVCFRKDVVDDILDSHVIEQYVGEKYGNCGHRNCYIRYKFSDVVSDIPVYVNELVEYNRTAPEMHGMPLLYGMHPASSTKVAKYIHENGYRYSSLVRVTWEIGELIKTGDVETATELVRYYLIGSFIDNFMDQTRKLWVPGGHEGSQNQDTSGYRTLIDVIGRSMDRDRATMDDWGDDD